MSDPLTDPAPPPVAPVRPPQRLHGRLAALGIVGAAMVALPLAQLLRYQGAELQALVTDSAGLDPLSRTVELQRGLITHRDLASQVLRGRQALEPERRQCQGDVDHRVVLLAEALAGGPWLPAIRESDDLRQDWGLLAGQVAVRSISAAESDQGHRLLTEQALQVIDLVADASAPHAERGDDGTAALLASARALPALVGRLDALAAAAENEGDPEARARDLAAAEAALAKTLGSLDATLERAGGLPLLPAPQRQALATASAGAGAAAERLFQQLRAPHPRLAATRPVAAAAVLQTQFQLFALTRQAVAQALDQRVAAVQQHRRRLLAGLAALGLLALGLSVHLLRGLRAWEQAALAPRLAGASAATVPPATTPASAMPASGSRAVANRLLARLRAGDQPQPTRARPERSLPPDF